MFRYRKEKQGWNREPRRHGEPQECRVIEAKAQHEGVPDDDLWKTATRGVKRPMAKGWVNIDGTGWEEMQVDWTLGQMWLRKEEE